MSEIAVNVIGRTTWELFVEGHWLPIPIEVHMPTEVPEHDDYIWRCNIVIKWPDGKSVNRRALGVDSVDAICNAVLLLGKERQILSEKIGHMIRFPQAIYPWP